jgi:dipeptidyl aminopeptidase/acylaminoacyl peptidase
MPGILVRSTLVLLLAALAGPLDGQTRRMTLVDLGREVGLEQPRLAPDGRTVVLVTRRTNYQDDRFERTLVLVDVGAGSRRVLTPGRRSVGNPQWSPTGDRIAFTDAADGQAAQLYVLPLSGGEARRVTDAPRGVEGFAWRPDGARLLHRTQASAHSGQTLHSTASLKVLATGEERPLGAATGIFGGFVLSPDGRRVVSQRPRGPEFGFRASDVIVTDLDGGTQTSVAPSLDLTIQSASWLPDASGLVLMAPAVTRIGVWLQPIGGQPRRLDFGPIDPISELVIGKDGSAIFAGKTPGAPAELFHLARLDGPPRKLTDFNAELAGFEFGRVETVKWDGPNGFKENGVLIYPPGFERGRRYPLVLDIHGGPMGTSTEGWSAFDQLLAAQGWLVFLPNYRGSTNMGDAYQRAVVNDAGEGPGLDVMAGLEAVKAMGIVDESRIGVSGWSYGGYMTAWLTSHFDGWRAAMAGAAVTDWYDWYNLADMNVWAGYGLGGSPWLNDNAQNYWRQSPIAYAHRIRTPTLILSTTGDPRVTVTQSYKLYHALKDNGVEVKFVAYPVGGHFPPDPIHQRDVYRRWIDWMRDHFATSSEGNVRTGRKSD